MIYFQSFGVCCCLLVCYLFFQFIYITSTTAIQIIANISWKIENIYFKLQ